MGDMREYIRQAREKRTAPPAPAQPQPAADPKPVRAKVAKPQKVEADVKLVVTRSCGCREAVLYLQKSNCPGCVAKSRRNRNRQKQGEPGQSPKKLLDQPGRLPHGAHFDVTYDAEKMEWSGTLTVNGQVFEGSVSGVMTLLRTLDGQFRENQQ